MLVLKLLHPAKELQELHATEVSRLSALAGEGFSYRMTAVQRREETCLTKKHEFCCVCYWVLNVEPIGWWFWNLFHSNSGKTRCSIIHNHQWHISSSNLTNLISEFKKTHQKYPVGSNRLSNFWLSTLVLSSCPGAEVADLKEKLGPRTSPPLALPPAAKEEDAVTFRWKAVP